MSLPRATIEGRPTLTIIDLIEKHKGTGAFHFTSLADAIRYISRTLGEIDESLGDLQTLADYMARDGAAWVKGLNFHSKKLPSMIKEMELTGRHSVGRRSVPFGVLVISTSKNGLSRLTQMRKLKVAARKVLRYLNVDKNRAILAIHDDTDHLHLHIVYNRYDSSGQLTEREVGKFRRYLMEDVCARVAFDIGYNLESGAQTVPLQTGELYDLASSQIIRTIGFDPIMAGCKARNEERRKARTGHELEEIALEAYRTSESLPRFRAKLASSGIRYVHKGSGAAFIDADGRSHKASKVNYCLSRGRIFNGAYKEGLPDESQALLNEVEAISRSWGVPKPASGDDAPLYHAGSGLSQEQIAEANRRLQRGYSDSRCGRARKIDMSEGWPTGFPWGGVRLPLRYLHDLRSCGIEIKNRRYHTELWREQRLIAVHLQGQIVVYTRDKEDLRILLLAAHEKWGSVELIGSTAFKNKMADLATELNVPITNSDLQRRISARQQKLKARSVGPRQSADATYGVGKTTSPEFSPPQSHLEIRGPTTPSVARVEAAAMPETSHKVPDVSQRSKMDREKTGLPSHPTASRAADKVMEAQPAAAGRPSADRMPARSSVTASPSNGSVSASQPSSPPSLPPPTSQSIELGALLNELRASDQFVERAGNGRFKLAHYANYRRMLEPRLNDPQLQTGLAGLYEQQQTELDQLEAAFDDVRVSIHLVQDTSVRRQQTYEPAGLQIEAAKLYHRYRYHPRCQAMLRAEFDRREVKPSIKDERCRADQQPARPASPLTPFKNAGTIQPKTDDVVITGVVETHRNGVVARGAEPREEAHKATGGTAAQKPDQQRPAPSAGRAPLPKMALGASEQSKSESQTQQTPGNSAPPTVQEKLAASQPAIKQQERDSPQASAAPGRVSVLVEKIPSFPALKHVHSIEDRLPPHALHSAREVGQEKPSLPPLDGEAATAPSAYSALPRSGQAKPKQPDQGMLPGADARPITNQPRDDCSPSPGSDALAPSNAIPVSAKRSVDSPDEESLRHRSTTIMAALCPPTPPNGSREAIGVPPSQPPSYSSKGPKSGVGVATSKPNISAGHLASSDEARENELLHKVLTEARIREPTLDANIRHYLKAPEGQDKDRLAYVVNEQLNIKIGDRWAFPRLKDLFSASDRNLQKLERQAQQAQLLKVQRGLL